MRVYYKKLDGPIMEAQRKAMFAKVEELRHDATERDVCVPHQIL